MSDDTIYRQAAIDALMCLVKQHECDLMPDLLHWTGVKAMLESLPAAQRKGKWIYLNGLDAFECSVCGRQMVRNIFDYCPWCGAEMRGEQDE